MRWGIFIASLYIMVPSWLSVDRAIIFFISHSAIAADPAMHAVMAALKRRINWREGIFCRVLKKRIRINTPAVTRVEEWTSADTGVGAAMAAGSQLMNGNCALLVIAAMINKEAISLCEAEVQGWRGNQWVLIHHAMVRRIRASPNRFVIAVIIAAPWDLGVW